MPLTKKGEKIKRAMAREYGAEKGERVFYASANKGTISGVEKGKHGGAGSPGRPYHSGSNVHRKGKR